MSVVIFEGDNLVAVTAYTSDESLHHASYWENAESDPIKKFAKTFYIATQKRRCCYCKAEIPSSNHGMWTLDHVIPRSEFPEFMFVPENLAAACPDCNIAKSNKLLIDRKSRKRFTRNSKAYLIVHPHFDIWSDHIRKIGKYVYWSKDKKGATTIKECGLFRYAQDKVPGGTISDDRYEALVDELIFGKKKTRLKALKTLIAIVEAEEDDEEE